MVKYDLDITSLYSWTLDKTLSHAHKHKPHRRSHSTHTRTHDTLPHHSYAPTHTFTHWQSAWLYTSKSSWRTPQGLEVDTESSKRTANLCVFLLRWIIYAALSLPRSWLYFITLSSTFQTSALIWTEMLLIPGLPLCSSINQIHSISLALFLSILLTQRNKNTITSQLFLLAGKVIKRRAHVNCFSWEKKPQ